MISFLKYSKKLNIQKLKKKLLILILITKMKMMMKFN